MERVEGQGVESAWVTLAWPQYLIHLGGTAGMRNLALAVLRGSFDRLEQRHVCIPNPAASVQGFKDRAIEVKTPEISVEQTRTLLASVDTGHVVGSRDQTS